MKRDMEEEHHLWLGTNTKLEIEKVLCTVRIDTAVDATVANAGNNFTL